MQVTAFFPLVGELSCIPYSLRGGAGSLQWLSVLDGERWASVYLREAGLLVSAEWQIIAQWRI
jgi:hypothetical protein